MNDIKKSIRKNQDILSSLGYAIIIFNLWAIVKSLLYYTCAPETYTNAINLIDSNIETSNFWLWAILIVAVEFLVRIFIGISAIKEGKNTISKKIVYLILSIILTVFAVLNIVSDIYIIFIEINRIAIVSIVVDAFSLAIFLGIIISGIKIKKYYKMIKGENN